MPEMACCSSLWTYLTARNSDMASQILHRAQHNPLTVDITFNSFANPSSRRGSFKSVLTIAKAFVRKVSQFEKLRISGSLSEVHQIVDAFKTPTPWLKHLSLEAEDHSGFLAYDGTWSVTSHAYVSLTGCFIPFDTDFYCNLNSLSLTGFSDEDDCHQSSTEILRILRQNPALTFLHLYHIIDADAGPPAADVEDVELSRLKSMEFEALEVVVWSHLLSKVKAPNLRYLHISLSRFAVPTMEEAEDLGRELQRALCLERRTLLRLKCKDSDRRTTVSLVFFRTIDGEPQEVNVEFDYIDGARWVCVYRFLTHLFSSWPLHDLISVHIDSNYGEDTSVSRFLQRLSTIHSLCHIGLRESGIAATVLLNSLADPSKFPNLTSLELEGVDMGRISHRLALPQSMDNRGLDVVLRKCIFSSASDVKKYHQLIPFNVLIVHPIPQQE